MGTSPSLRRELNKKKKKSVYDVGKLDDGANGKIALNKQTKTKKEPQVLLKSEAIQLLYKVSVQSVKETKRVKVNPSAGLLNWQSSILTGQK